MSARVFVVVAAMASSFLMTMAARAPLPLSNTRAASSSSAAAVAAAGRHYFAAAFAFTNVPVRISTASAFDSTTATTTRGMLADARGWRSRSSSSSSRRMGDFYPKKCLSSRRSGAAVTTAAVVVGPNTSAIVSAIVHLPTTTTTTTTKTWRTSRRSSWRLSSSSSISGENDGTDETKRKSWTTEEKEKERENSNNNNNNNKSDENNKKRIVFLGTPDVAAMTLRSMTEHSKMEGSTYDVVGVVTQPPKRRKRRGKEIPSPVGLVAEELSIPVLCPEKASNVEFLDAMEGTMRPDLCVTAAYGQYLPKRFLDMPTYGTVNIHPSLLPRWRGASPVQRSLEAGDNPVGVSVLFTVSKMDAGPIISQRSIDIDDTEQATTLLPKLFEIGTNMLLDAISGVLDGRINMNTATPQDENGVVNAGMIHSSEGELRVWEQSATVCHNKCRGFSIWPGTYLFVRTDDDEYEYDDDDDDRSDDRKGGSDKEPTRLKVLETRVVPGTKEPTDILCLGPKKGDGLRVICGDGSILELMRVQPATKKAMDARSFVNGLRGTTVRWVRMPDEEGGGGDG